MSYNYKNKDLLVLFDPCSDISIIKESAAKELNLTSIGNKVIPVTTLGQNTTNFESDRVILPIREDNKNSIELELQTIPLITESVTIPEITEDNSKKIEKITGAILNAKQEHEREPHILIGIDNFWKIVSKEFRSYCLDKDLIIIPSYIGPIICQSTHQPYANERVANAIERYVNEHASVDSEIIASASVGLSPGDLLNEKVDRSLKCFLTGTKLQKTEKTTKELRRKIDDEIAWKKFNENISIENKRLSVLFPIKNNVQSLDDNYGRSLGCLKGLLKQLENKPDLLIQYNETFREQVKNNILEFAPKDSHPFLTYYMPHHFVLKLSSNTTKLRVVLNASSKGKNTKSLNDILYQGEGIIPNLVGMLIRLRLCKNFIMGDIEKAFHQIELKQAHRDLTRVLWVKDPEKGIRRDNLITLRHTRIPFGVNSSPFLLAASIIHFLKKEKRDLNESIMRNIYVDNIMLKVENEAQCLQLYGEIKNMFSQISMNVREFYCTNAASLEQIPEKDRMENKSMKILGLQYDTRKDSFSITIPEWDASMFTKTTVLSYINSVFDPVGISQPILLEAKLFLKKIHELKVEWKEQIEDEKLTQEWKAIVKKIENKTIVFDRKIRSDANSEVEYALFCDASKDVIASVGYLVEKDRESIQNISFLNSKCSTMTEGTIPMKELSALVLGMKLLKDNLKELDTEIRTIKVYTDSQVVLHWIFKNPQKKIYIRNRMEKILKLKEEIEREGKKVTYHYIKTEVNPADIPTRGAELEDEKFQRWKEGPVWMKNEKIYKENVKSMDDIVNREQDTKNKIINLFIKSKRDRYYENIEKLIEQHSSFPKIMRIVRLMLLFICKSGKGINNQSKLLDEFKNSNHISTQNKLVEKIIIKMHQEQNIQYLSKKKYKCLDIVIDSYGILRVRGRIRDDTKDNSECPILLFGKTNYVKLFLKYIHGILLHANRNTMIAIIRKEFCIINMKSVVNTITTKCVECQKLNNRPYQYPIYPVLPVERTSIFKPFENIGIDYAGPLYVSDMNENNQSKVWVMLITCMCTRAVYLDVANDCSAKELMLMLRKFFARKRVPASITSDNGTQFIKTDKILETFLDDRRIQWKFITPYSPWKGGFYERMIGVTKKILMKNLGLTNISKIELSTLLCEVENIINNRPLTNIETDFEEIITPLSLEFYHPSNLRPDSLDSEKKLNIESRNDVKHWMDKNNKAIKTIWEEWSEKYIEELRISHKRISNSNNYCINVPKTGDIVMCMDSKTKRNKWPIAIIERVIISEDGKIRTVIVRNSNHDQMRRSVNQLIPLELDQNNGEAFHEHTNFTVGKQKEQIGSVHQLINSEKDESQLQVEPSEEIDKNKEGSYEEQELSFNPELYKEKTDIPRHNYNLRPLTPVNYKPFL